MRAASPAAGDGTCNVQCIRVTCLTKPSTVIRNFGLISYVRLATAENLLRVNSASVMLHTGCVVVH